MAQGKRISADIDEDAIHAIQQLGSVARAARLAAGESQGVAATRLGVHVQTIGRIESGEPGVAVGHVFGLLALYGVLPPAAADVTAGTGSAHTVPSLPSDANAG